MKIPKIFGNIVVLIVVALAILLIVIISLGNLAFTGFAGKNKQTNEVIQEETINTHDESSEPPSIQQNPDSEYTPSVGYFDDFGSYDFLTTPQTDTSSQTLTDTQTQTETTTKKTTHSHGGGGSSEDSNSNINPNSNPDDNSNPNPHINSKKKLTKKPKNLNLKKDGTEINEGEEFEGKVRLNLYKSNRRISDFDIDFNKDIDISDIVADSDFSLGKAYMHSTSGVLENIDLYVPIEEGDIAVVVCSNADSYDEIYYGCSDNPDITKEELLYLSGPRVDRSPDGNYFIVHGITGTGAMGMNVTEISSTSQNATAPGSLDAYAGNITNIMIPQGFGTTQAWAGYFGNVSGAIMLADSGDNVMYNWSLSSPEGEVFASTNNSIVWNHIQCFNLTASGTYQSESGTGGTTNLYGTNLTQLETQYGIEYDDLDGVDETFYLQGAGTHNTFYVNANEFEEGECQNTRVIDSSGWGNNDHFEEVLLYEPITASVVFCALLNEDLLGFDDRTHDFEMLVLENGHLTDTSPTTYYFYAMMY
jgi:hypothetical protein